MSILKIGYQKPEAGNLLEKYKILCKTGTLTLNFRHLKKPKNNGLCDNCHS